MKPFNFTAPSCEYHDGECDCPVAEPEDEEGDPTVAIPAQTMRALVESRAS